MEEWMEHVKAVCGGDGELAHGVQLLCGSALFGEVYQEGLDFLFGDGSTGKSTLFNSVYQVLGTYARSFDVNALVAVNNDDAAKRTAAHLRGCRFALSGELEHGRRLSEAVLKRLTSSDPVHSEKKYENGKDFIKPTFHMMLYTNFLPAIKSFDAGTWRRVRVWPFFSTVPHDRIIPNYARLLVKRCGGAILKWCISGAVEFARNGYKYDLPAAVKRETERYRKGQIWVTPFLDESESVDVENPNGRARAGELYQEYTHWAETTNTTTYSEREFCKAMRAAGYTDRRDKQGKYWQGITLATVAAEPMEIL